jgi:hypothetical protein
MSTHIAHRRSAALVAACAAGAALVLLCIALGAPGGAQPFSPLRGNYYTAWNTDRDLVDIEIVGSTSQIPEHHRLEPERILRFRLEKAYVSALLAEKEPGYEIIGFSFDLDTGLPESFLQAAFMKGPGHEDIPGVSVLTLKEQIERVLLIQFHSDWSIEPLERMSRETEQCRGRQLESDLFENDPRGGKACIIPGYPRTSRYLAPYDADISLIIRCQNEPIPSIDCDLRFPYRGFAVELRFNHARLAKWRENINRAIKFLNAKEYR